jgi:hypothetical protein
MSRIYETAVMLAAKDPSPSFNPQGVLDKSQTLAVGALSLIFIVISVIAAVTVGRRGNPGKAAAIVAAVLICSIPAGIALAYSMKTFLPGITGWIF